MCQKPGAELCEFHRKEITLLVVHGRARHPANLLLLSAIVDQIEQRIHGQILRADQHCAMIVHRRCHGAHCHFFA